MADTFISWDEIEDGAFPDCCMTCGAEDTELVSRKLMTHHFGYRRHLFADLPFCRAHASRPWLALGRTDARSFTDDGVWMKNLSPIFVEEMEAFRDEEEEYEQRRRRKRHGQRRKRARDDDDDADDPRRPRRRLAQPSGGSTALIVIATLLLIPAVLGGACCVGNLFLGGGRVQMNQGGPVAPGPPPLLKNRPR